MQSASIYLRGEKCYVSPLSRTIHGAWIVVPPLYVIGIERMDEVANSLRMALGQSVVGVAHPTDFKALVAPLLEAAGAKTWGRFARRASLIIVDKKDQKLQVRPWGRSDRKGSFTMTSTSIEIDERDGDDVLGKAISEASRRSE